MAANFWTSTHSKWLVSKQKVAESHKEDRMRGLTDTQIKQLNVYFTQGIFELVRTSKLRQRVAATAVTYFRRFYLRHNFCQNDPRLVAPGCVYLASKADETIIAAKVIVTYMKKIRSSWNYDVKHLLDIEMVILEGLDCNLVVFSPYTFLSQLLPLPALQSTDHMLAQNTWACLNDLYRTDLPLLHPPHLLAIACVALAAALCRTDITQWMQTLDLDLNQVFDICQEMVTMYEKQRAPVSQEECSRMLDSVLLQAQQ